MLNKAANQVLPLLASLALLLAVVERTAIAQTTDQQAQAGEAKQEPDIAELVSRRFELMGELRSQQASGEQEAEILPTAIALHQVEVALISAAANSDEVDPEELKLLRTHHVDLLSWMADAFEKSNLQAALAARQDAVRQLEIANGKEHWTTRTAQFHVERVKLMQAMPAEDLEAVRLAAQRQIEGTQLAAEGKVRAALAAQSFALDARIRCFGPDYWLTARSMNEVGLLVSQLGDLSSADKLYRQTISIYLKYLGPDHPALATLLANLADVCRQRAMLQDAEVFQVEAIRLYAILDNGQGPQSAQAINHLSMIRLDQGRWQEALEIAEQAEELLDEFAGQGGAAILQLQAMVSSNLAAIEVKRGDLDAAQSHAEDAIDVVERVFGPTHMHTAQLRNNLGHILMEQGDFAAAEAEFIKAIEIYRAQELITHNVANAYKNLGDLQRRSAQYDQARQSLHDALKTLQQTVGEAHPDMASVLNLLALVEVDQGNWDAASNHLQQAVQITRGSLGENHPRYLLVMENSIALAQAQRNRQQVRQLVEQAATVALDIFGEEHPEYAEHLSRLGQFAADAEEFGLAESLLRSGTQLLKQELGDRHPEYAEAAARLGRVYVSTNQAERGEALIREGLNILGTTLGEEHPKYAKALNSLGEAYVVAQNLDDAESTLRAGADVLARHLGKKHPEYGVAVRDLAELYLAKGEATQSQALVTESAEILSVALGKRHPEYAETLRTMANVYNLLQEPDKAAALRAEAESILQELAAEQIRAGQQRLWQELNEEIR